MCRTSLGKNGTAKVDASAPATDSGVTILDAIKNLNQAAQGYASSVSSNLSGQGNITLGQLLGPHASITAITARNLPARTGRTRTFSIGLNSVPISNSIMIDINEVNSQAVSFTGNSARELYVTILHEFAHALIDKRESLAGIDFEFTVEDETALDNFAADLLDKIEMAASESDNNPFESEACNG